MKRLPSSYELGIKAFRALTEAEVDGAATRARVLERAARPRYRIPPRHLALCTLGLVSISLSAAAGWNALPAHWHAPRAQRLDAAPDLDSAPLERRGRRPVRTIPPVVDEDTTPADGAGETSVYATAHRLHFVAGTPARALAAWEDYLRAYPRGVFAPEARYNRALCLIQLRRLAEAERALHAFVRVSSDGYRRAEAERLLDWIRARASSREGP